MLSLLAVASLARPAPAAAATPLLCDQNTLYAIDSGGQLAAITISTHAKANVTDLSPANNGLAIAENGNDAYGFENGGKSVTHYHPATDDTSTISNVESSNTTVIRGAINPATGIYYYGGSGTSATIGAFDTNTDTKIGKVGTITGLNTGNGDFAFSSRGLLFVVTGNEVRRVDDTTIPEIAGNMTLSTSLVATLPSGTNSPGIAFSTDGFLYVSNGSTIIKLDPASGAMLDSFTIPGGFSPTDLATCNYPNTISAQASVTERVNPGDQFALSITGGDIISGNTATTTGTTPGVQAEVAGAALTIPGRTYTVTQTAAGTTVMSQYTSSYSCVNVNNNQQIASGPGTTGSFVFPAAPTATGTDVVCTFTNTPTTATVRLSTVLGNPRGADSDQFTVGLHAGDASGPVVNDTTNSTTGGTGATVTAGSGATPATTLVANRPYTITQNIAPGSTSVYAQYHATITCVDDNAVQTGLPTNAPFTGSLQLTPLTGAAISCTVTNSTNAPALQLVKALGTPRFVATDQFTVAIHTGSPTGPIVGVITQATTVGTGSTVQAGTGVTNLPVASASTTYYLTESATANASRYTSQLTCVDSNGFQNGLPSGIKFTGSYAITPEGGTSIGCTLTNSQAPASFAITKTNPPSLTVGVASSYTINITNTGALGGTTRMTDQLPVNVKFSGYSSSGWTCNATGDFATTGQLVTCDSPTILGGFSRPVTITVVPQPGAGGQSVSNHATVDTDGGTNPGDPNQCTGNGTPDAGCAVTPALPVASGIDLSLAKANPTKLTVGVASNYTLTVTNHGTGPALSATVVDVLPANLQYNSASGATCSAAGQVLTCTVPGPIAANGGTKQFTINVTPQPAAAGQSVLNRAAVDVDGGNDPFDPSGCTGNATPDAGCAIAPALLVGNGVKLSLAKSNPASLTVGVASGYPLTVTNNGTGPASIATTVDVLPANLTYNSASGATCSAVSQVVTCTVHGPIAAGGGTKQFTINVTPQPAAAGQSVVNKAAVDVGGGPTPSDPTLCTGNASPNAGCAVTPAELVGNGVTLALTKTNPASLTVGVPSSYPLTVANHGTGPADSATVVDTLPDDLAFDSASGATCSAVGQVVVCTVAGPIVASGGTKSFTITVVPQPGAADRSVMNKAAVDTDGGTTPSDPSDCTGDATPDAGCAVTPGARVANGVNLSLTKSNPASLTVGVASDYALTVTNNGTGPADAATVRDVLPDNLDYVSASGAACSASGQVVTCTVAGPIAANGASASFTIRVLPQAPAADQSVANAATVDTDGGNDPSDPSDCTDNATPDPGCAVTPTAPVGNGVDLSLAKTNPASLTVGVASDYALTVTNNGTGPATSATVVDVLPDNLQYNSAAGAACTAASQVLTCTVAGPIAANGGTKSFTVNVTPLPAAADQSLINAASVDRDGGDDPSDPTDCTGTGTPDAGCAVTPAEPVGNGVDLLLAKSNPANFTVGVASDYLLTVTNHGTGPANSATVTDALPDGLRFNSAVGASCAVVGQVLTCTVAGPIVANGGSASFTVNVTPQPELAASHVANQAAVDVDGGNDPFDPTHCAGNATPDAGCAVTPDAPVANGIDLTLDKTNPNNLTVGVATDYVVTVTNAGTGPSSTATVVDVLPDNLVYNSATGADCTATGQVLTCLLTRPIAPNGASQFFTVYVTPQPAANGMSVVNTAAVDPTGGSRPTDPTTCTATGTPAGCAVTAALLVGTAELHLVKAATPVAPATVPVKVNQQLAYTFTITNASQVTVSNIRVDDAMVDPVTCPVTSLAAGDSTTCTAAAHTVTQAEVDAGSVVNTASAQADLPACATDCVVTSPDSSTMTPTLSVAGLSVVKTGKLGDANGDGQANAGERIDYTIHVTNTGTVTLTDVRVDDVLIPVRCPGTTLAVGKSMDCTGNYTVQAKDETAGTVRNVATAHATAPSGQDVSSPSSPKAEVDLPAGAVEASLPHTGVAAIWMIFDAAILLMLGLALLVIGRRRRVG